MAGHGTHSPNQTKISHLAQSAKKKMSATKKDSKVVERCPHASAAHKSTKKSKNPETTYEPCELKSLHLNLQFDGKVKLDYTLSSQLREEPVVSTVYSKYKSYLTSHDVVIEALADIENTTDTYAPSLPLQKIKSGATQDSKTLSLTLTALNSAKHFSHAPAHPHTDACDGHESDGGTPVKRDIFAPSRESAGHGWLSVWPFGSARTRTYALAAEACGVQRKPKPLKQLSMQLVVIPSEEWEISLGINKGGGASRERGNMRGVTGKEDALTVKKYGGGFEESTETKFLGGDDFEETVSIKERTGSRVLGSTTYSLETKDTTKAHVPTGQMPEAKTGFDLNSITISCTSAGEKKEFPVSEIVNTIRAIEKIQDGIKMLFPLKIGWVFNMNHSWLQGGIVFKWGNRYPSAYKQEARVYYIERFISVGGSCTLYKGSIEGFFGIEIDPWYYPVSVCAKIALKAETTVKIDANISTPFTNPDQANVGKDFNFNGGVDIALTLEAKAAGRIHGQSITARIALEGQIESKLEGKLSFSHPPSLVANVEAKPLKIVGQVITTGGSSKTREFKPVILWDGGTLCKDKELWPARKSGGATGTW